MLIAIDYQGGKVVFRLLEIVEYSQLVGIHNYHQPRRSFHCSSNLFCFSCRNPLKHRITDEALEAQSIRPLPVPARMRYVHSHQTSH